MDLKTFFFFFKSDCFDVKFNETKDQISVSH